MVKTILISFLWLVLTKLEFICELAYKIYKLRKCGCNC